MSTSRRLIIMRHAKSDWHSGAPNDHARPLNDRGRRDAPHVAAELVRLGWKPDVVLASDSARTRETFDLMASRLDEPHAHFIPALYHGGVTEIRQSLDDLPSNARCVLALGHNPGWEEVVAWLCGEPTVMPTAACALLETVAGTWADSVARPRQWTLRHVLRPKEL